ncbi:MAG: choice-of-anchor B family protein [Bacteroidota bacterium]
MSPCRAAVRVVAAIAIGLAIWIAGAPPLHAQPEAVPCENGQAGPYACDRVDLLAEMDLVALGSSYAQGDLTNWWWGNDIWGWTDPETGTEYALVGTWEGVSFVDLSTPTAPVLVGMLPTAAQRGDLRTIGNLWRDIKTRGTYAYIVSEVPGHGVQVFDLRRLRSITEAPVEFEPDARYTGIGSAHNIVASDDLDVVIAVGHDTNNLECLTGLYLIDVTTPTAPRYSGCFGADGYTHDAQCIVYDGPDPDYQGRTVCFSSNTIMLSISDITEPARTRALSTAIYPTVVFTHQGWLTEDRRFFFMNDEGDDGATDIGGTRTIVMNVEDLDAPFYVGAYIAPTTTIDHNHYIAGDLLFQANYESGFRLHRINPDDPAALTLVGFFDTYPESDSFGSNGAWSVYPFFESGIVIVSDQQRGLFVLQPAATAVAGESAPDGAVARLSAAYPNPFGDRTTLTLTLDSPEHVRAEVYDLLGRRVATLLNDTTDGALLTVDGAGLPSGVYVVRVVGETFAETRRLTLAR